VSGGSDALGFVYLVGVLAIVVSALLVRRIPIGQGLKMAAGWVLIFLAVFAVFTVWDDIKALGARMWGEIRGEAQIVQAGDELRIRKSPDGHFWVVAALNGEQTRFMIDSGATLTAITADTARRAGIVPSSQRIAIVETANGEVVAPRGRADLRVGTIERPDHALLVSEAFGETNVIGMNFLSSLSSWGVEGQWLVLKP